MHKNNIFIILYICIYIYINTLFLPHGLLYTSFLSPILFYWLAYKKNEKKIIRHFFIIIIPFLLIHVIYVVNELFFIQTFISLLTVVITAIAVVVAIRDMTNKYAFIDALIVINFILSIIAISFIDKEIMGKQLWTKGGYGIIPRLQMLTYEPSYYATIFSPFLLYSIIRCFDLLSLKNIIFLCFSAIPIFMTLSMGVISCVAISLLVTIIYYRKKIINSSNAILKISPFALIALVFIFISNPISKRADSVYIGEDTSGNNRIFESSVVAYSVAKETSVLFGAGIGQDKIYIPKYMNEFWKDMDINRLTNSVAGTLSTFGLVGLIIRFYLEISLFIKTGVNKSIYRFMVFIFIFIYQFTGSYLTNVAEYVLWGFAYMNIFAKEYSDDVRYI